MGASRHMYACAGQNRRSAHPKGVDVSRLAEFACTVLPLNPLLSSLLLTICISGCWLRASIGCWHGTDRCWQGASHGQ